MILTPVNTVSCVNSGFRREVDENCALLGYYAASSSSSSSSSSTDKLSRTVGKKLPLLAT